MKHANGNRSVRGFKVAELDHTNVSGSMRLPGVETITLSVCEIAQRYGVLT